MTHPPTGAPGPLPHGPDDRLDSWKQIASYLKRDVSTVQRWEHREHLPIRRHRHGRLGSVYAFKPEIDAWLNDGSKPGPKGPDEALIRAIVELKSRNPRFGCPRIARIISRTFGVVDKNVVHRVLATHDRPTSGGSGPSWLSFIGHATDSLWSVDLFRCESIVLRSYWVLVVMDQFHALPRRRRGALWSGHWRRPLRNVQRRHSWSGHTATPQHRS
jgi:hypothetical protein